MTCIVQAFSFARTNSDSVKQGMPCNCMIVELSSRRGPCSPAGRISIFNSAVIKNIAKNMHKEKLTSMAGMSRRYVACKLDRLGYQRDYVSRRLLYRLLHGECVVVKCSLPTMACLTRRKGCVEPPSTIQNISWRHISMGVCGH